MSFTSARLALVMVTYNRSAMLARALASIEELQRVPDIVVIVNNASTDDTSAVLRDFTRRYVGGDVQVMHNPTNVGGAGGFAAGIDTAMQCGAEWIFVMDDDVEILPRAFDELAPYTTRFWALQGRRLAPEGGFERWQPYVTPRAFLPVRRTPEFGVTGAASVTAGIFEGMLFHADVVRAVGLPDARFFIAWDDVMFAWQASLIAPVGYVNVTTLRKQPRHVRVNLPDRKVMAGSAMHRYYTIRNRGYVRHYAALHGRYRPVAFWAGTALLAGKEVLRLAVTRQSFLGVRDIARGVRDAVRIATQSEWEPSPKPQH